MSVTVCAFLKFIYLCFKSFFLNLTIKCLLLLWPSFIKWFLVAFWVGGYTGVAAYWQCTGSHSFAKARNRCSRSVNWGKPEIKYLKRQHVGGFAWVKNDKVFPAQSARRNRPNQIYKQSVHSEEDYHGLRQGIIVKLRLLVATCHPETRNNALRRKLKTATYSPTKYLKI